jgi:predicted NUDIX family NTP pyrophosphohydrolase
MLKRSAGLLMYRRASHKLEVFLVHPGGPFWAKKDLGAWSLPKGEYRDQEDPLEAAQREFHEETGFVAQGRFVHLGERRQPSGKTLTAWAFEGNCDPAELTSGHFPLEWPPHSGRRIQVPEVDRAGWFTIKDARMRIVSGQVPFIDRLVEKVTEAR